MDNSTIKSVRETFGTPFLKYCLNNKIILTKNEHGAFMVPNHDALTNCLHYLDRLKLKLNNQLKIIQRLPPINSKPEDQCYNMQRSSKLQKCKANKEQKSTSMDLSFEIYLRDTSSIVPSYTIHSIQTKCILDTAKSGNELYDYIINTTMKNIIITDYEASIPSVSLLLEQFQKKHKKFHYSSVLKHLTDKQELNQNTKCEYEINLKQMKRFFDLVFAKVIPLSMFGKLRNMKKMKKALFHLIKLPRFKSLNLMLYINKLDISDIKWLQNIKNIEVARLVIAKFVKWFFNGFLMKILHIYFHITTVSPTNNKRMYIIRTDWCKINKKFIKQRKRSNALQPDIKCKNEWNPPIGIYKLNPKSHNVRPILVLDNNNTNAKNNDEEKHLYTLHKFLRQLHATEYGLSSFGDKWRSIVQHKCILNNEKLYLVSCDVVDAFGSIVQGQLYDIIRSLCDKLPENLTLRYYAIKSKRGNDSNITCYKQYTCDSHLQLPFASGILYARTNHTEFVKKKWLIERIRRYIFCQKVKIRGKCYVIGKGIAQGTMLSPILSDIYFDFMIHREMTMFLKAGKIIKYVDDILFATKCEDSAKQFLGLTAKGIPQYNCRFKKSKIQTNMVYENTITDHIIYVGYKINCNTLELEPNILNTNLRHLTISYKKNVDPLDLLKSKLLNLSSLRLSKFVLDSRVNSERTIRTILNKTCLLQAKRACILIKELFNNVKEYIQRIMYIIKSNNKRIARYIITVFLKFDENMQKSDVCRLNKEILDILWTSYKTIFMKDRVLQQYFMKVFEK